MKKHIRLPHDEKYYEVKKEAEIRDKIQELDINEELENLINDVGMVDKCNSYGSIAIRYIDIIDGEIYNTIERPGTIYPRSAAGIEIVSFPMGTEWYESSDHFLGDEDTVIIPKNSISEDEIDDLFSDYEESEKGIKVSFSDFLSGNIEEYVEKILVGILELDDYEERKSTADFLNRECILEQFETRNNPYERLWVETKNGYELE